MKISDSYHSKLDHLNDHDKDNEIRPPAEGASISRRDFVRGAAAASIAAVMGWIGYNAVKSPERRFHRKDWSEFYRLRTPENFPGKEWEVLANTPAFEGLGRGFVKSEGGQEFMKGKKALNILYPGAGIHLALLGAVKSIADGAEELEQFNLIYTEINPQSYLTIDKHLKTIVDKTSYFSDLEVSEKVFPAQGNVVPKQKTMIFKCLRSSGSPVIVNIIFELNRSGAAYYLPEHFAAADLLISHDGSPNGREAPIDVMTRYIKSFAQDHRRKEKVIFTELNNGTEGGVPKRLAMYKEISKKFLHIQEGDSYGCGANHRNVEPRRHSEFLSSAAIKLDTTFLNEISRFPSKERDAMITLITFARSNKGNLEDVPQEARYAILKQKALKYRNSILEAIETLLAFMQENKEVKRNGKIMDIIIASFSERFFYEPVERFPTLRKAIHSHMMTDLNRVDVPNYHHENDILNQLDLKHTKLSKMHWRKGRFLILLKVIEEEQLSKTDPLRKKLEELVGREIQHWFNSQELGKLLNVFLDNKKNLLIYSYNSHISIEERHSPHASKDSVRYRKEGFVDMNNPSREHGHLDYFALSSSQEVFEYFYAIAFMAKKLQLPEFQQICNRVQVTIKKERPNLANSYVGILHQHICQD